VTSIKHLNCVTMSPRAPGGMTPDRMVAHCLLVEGPNGLTLVDTGFGTADIAEKRMGRVFIALMGAALDPAETAVAQVKAAGYTSDDVTDIVLTHMDLDHAGGLGDFPKAKVHVFADELAAARARKTLKEKERYIEAQWAHGPDWVEHKVEGDSWLGFDSVKAVNDDVLLVPLRGHTRGHCGVAVKRPSGGWFLHAGDAYFNNGEKQTPPTCPSGLSMFQTMVQIDKKARHDNQDRLRSLHAEHGPESGASEVVTIFSAHDAQEYDALEGVTD
jgi:glyoxylase-like metal-dependent hydrolase (beta-lactamase superfamily II)